MYIHTDVKCSKRMGEASDFFVGYSLVFCRSESKHKIMTSFR